MTNVGTSVAAPPSTAAPEALPQRYRHPGDVIRLIGSGVLMLAAAAACTLAGTYLLGAGAVQVPGPEPGGVGSRFLVGLARAIVVLGSLAGLAVLVVTRRFRLLACLLGAAAVSTGAWIAVIHAVDRSGELSADRGAGSLLGIPALPGASLFAGAVAVTVVAGSWLNPAWQRVARGVLGLVALAQLLAGVALAMELLLALAIGWFVGAGVLVAFGAPDRRIAAPAIIAALTDAGLPVRDLHPAPEPGRGSRPFVATVPQGKQLFVKVLGPDQRDADLLYRAYRFARLRGVGDTRPAASLKQAVERQALGAVMAERAGVRVPHIHRIVTAADGSVLLAMDLVVGHSLERSRPEDVTDEQLRVLWLDVQRLHAAGVAHRSLRTANVMVDEVGRPWIVDFSFSEVAATDRQLALDRAELLASLAILVGPDRAASSAAVIGDRALSSAVPLLQPLALSSGTRRALRARGGLRPLNLTF